MSGGSEGPVMRTAEAIFGVAVGGPTSSPVTQGMRVGYSTDGTPVYKSIAPPPGGSPPNMNVVPDHHNHYQQQQLQHQQHHHHQQQPQQHQFQQQLHQVQQQSDLMKKKRGRPRKYSGGVGGPDVAAPLALMPPATATTQSAVTPQSGTGGEFSPQSGGGSEGPSFKRRGRPPGSTNKIKPLQAHQIQSVPLGSAGVGFTPHVIDVKAGEDVSSKIMSFSQNGPRAVCILSANGAISNVTLRQAATSGGTATYEGRFEILSLCGSFLLTEVGGQRSRTGGLSISLAGPDGRVLGGCVAGLLTAASPVQVIVGSFVSDGRKESKAQNHPELTHISSPPNPMPMSMQPMIFAGSGYAAPTTGVSGSPPSHGDASESSGEEGSTPPDHSQGGHANNHHINNNSNPQGILGMPWR